MVIFVYVSQSAESTQTGRRPPSRSALGRGGAGRHWTDDRTGMAVLPGLAAASRPRGRRQVFLPLDILYIPSHSFFRRQGQAEVRDATCGARLGRRGGRYRLRAVSQAEGFGVMMVGEHGNGLHQHADPNQQYRFNPWPHRLAFLLNPMAKVAQKSLPHNYLPRNLVAKAA